MDARSKYLILIFINFIYLFLISFFWQDIKYPLNNTENVIGALTIRNINPINDTIRFILFTGPVFLFSYIYLRINFRNKFYNLKDILFPNDLRDNNLNLKNVILIKILFFVFILLEFLSLDFSKYILIDSLHDGDFLTPLKNYEHKKGLWSNSFVIHGGADLFIPVLASKIFGNLNIASSKFLYIFCIFLVKFISILLCFQLSKISSLEKNYKIVAFIFSTIFLLSLSSYGENSYLNLRDLFVLIFFIILIQQLLTKKNIINLYLISLVTVLGLFFHYDTGIYLLIIFLINLCYFLIKKNFKDFIILLFFLILNIFLSLIYFGLNEMVNFFDQITHIVKNIDKVHGLEYPKPFTSVGEVGDGARATKLLIFYILVGFFIIFSTLKKNKFLNNNERILIFFLYLYSLFSYKNALGRSDGPHIMLSSDWITILFFFHFLLLTLNFIQKNLKRNLNFKAIFKSFNFVFIIFIAIYFFDKNVLNSYDNIKNYLNTPNSKFISIFDSQNRPKIIKKFSQVFQNESCINNFTVDLSLPYLLDKPSCSKFFSSWIVSGKTKEKLYINSLKEDKSKYIIYFSPQIIVDDIPTNKRLLLVNNYIRLNYSEFLIYRNYIILKKNEKIK